jgi:hypothetical protein
MDTSWRALQVYARMMPPLQAEEAALWLSLIHTADPKKMQAELRRHLTPTARPERRDETITAWLVDPFLREGIETTSPTTA